MIHKNKDSYPTFRFKSSAFTSTIWIKKRIFYVQMMFKMIKLREVSQFNHCSIPFVGTQIVRNLISKIAYQLTYLLNLYILDYYVPFLYYIGWKIRDFSYIKKSFIIAYMDFKGYISSINNLFLYKTFLDT